MYVGVCVCLYVSVRSYVSFLCGGVRLFISVCVCMRRYVCMCVCECRKVLVLITVSSGFLNNFPFTHND